MDQLTAFEKINGRTAKNADETDVFGPGRKALACLVNHPTGVTATKTRARRRDRRATAQLLRNYR